MNAPEELLPLIPQHWLRFPQPSPLVHVTLGVVFTVLTLLAFVGNLAVIILYCRYSPSLEPPYSLHLHNYHMIISVTTVLYISK